MPEYQEVDYDPFVKPDLSSALPPRALRDVGAAVTGAIGTAAENVLTLPQRGIEAAAVPAGTRREDYSDDPSAPEPLDALVGRSTDLTALVATGGLAGAEEGAAGVFGGRLAKTADLRKLNQAQHLAARGEHPDNIWAMTGWFQGADGKWRFEISDKHLQVGEGQGIGLGNQSLMKHPELEAAYPQQAAELSYKTGPGAASKGYFKKGDAAVGPYIDAEGKTPEEARSVAAHELQHFIQNIEGFATGHDPAHIYKYTAPRALKNLGVKPKDLTPEMVEKAKQASYEAYRRHAGETEARNVQKRLDMPSLDRAFTPPVRTEDVPRKDQIIRYEPVDYDPFLKASSEERIKGAAVKIGSAIYEAPNHWLALKKAAEHRNEDIMNILRLSNEDAAVDGFVTRDGRFVNREEADTIAAGAKQKRKLDPGERKAKGGLGANELKP